MASSFAELRFVTTAIDNVRDYWDNQMVNRHWTVLDVLLGSTKGERSPAMLVNSRIGCHK
jgi:hypothetical protein